MMGEDGWTGRFDEDAVTSCDDVLCMLVTMQTTSDAVTTAHDEDDQVMVQ